MVGATAAIDAEAGGKLSLERPPKPELGDYSTNAAMLLAPAAGAPPREVAERLRGRARPDPRRRAPSGSRSPAPGSSTSSSPIAGTARPSPSCSPPASGSGASAAESPERVMVEFVSANPTGPVTAASGRGAAFGDSVARLLEASGHAGRARVLPQRRRHPGAAVRRVDRRPDAGRRAARRTATRASTSPSSRPSSRPRAPTRTTSSGSSGWAPRRCGPGSRRPWSASASASTPGPRSGELRESGAVERALERLRGERPRLRERGRACGCGPPSSATTRTGS